MSFFHTVYRRRKYVFLAFAIFFVGHALWLLFGPKQYRASATVQGYGFQAAPVAAAAQVPPSGFQDIRASLRMMESPTVTEKVAVDIKDSFQKEFLAPYEGLFGSGKTVGEVLVRHRSVSLVPDSKMIEVAVIHPNPEIAAKVATLFADEFVKLNRATNDEMKAKLRANLQAQADQQKAAMDAIQKRMDVLIEKFGLSNLDAANDTIYVAAVQELERQVAQEKSTFETAAERWKQIQQVQLEGKPLWEVSFIATQPRVAALLRTYNDQNGRLTAMLAQQYAEDAPDVMVVRGRVTAAGAELADAAATAARMFFNDAQTTEANYNNAVKRLAEKRTEAQELARARTAYAAMRGEYDIAENLYKGQMYAMQQQETEFKLALPEFTVLQPAAVPLSPLAPGWRVWLGGGAIAGLVGAALAAIGLGIFYPVPTADRAEYERRRKRHSHFDPRVRSRHRKS